MTKLKWYNKFKKGIGKRTILHDFTSFFMLSVPHIIACSIISYFYFDQVFWIFMFGLILPDSALILHHYLRSPKIRKKFKLDYFDDREFFKKEWKLRKKMATSFHVTFYLLAFAFLYFGDYGVFLAAVSHLILDLVGF